MGVGEIVGFERLNFCRVHIVTSKGSFEFEFVPSIFMPKAGPKEFFWKNHFRSGLGVTLGLAWAR